MRRVQREDENVPDARGRESNADAETNAREEIAVFSRISFALLEIVVREQQMKLALTIKMSEIGDEPEHDL